MHIFLWTNPCRKFQNKDMMGKVLKFMLEINKGTGGTSAKNAQHAREAQITFPRCTVSILSKCSFTFVQVLSQPCLKIQIWWTTIKRNKIIASTLGSMQFELWNMILINHGCEQKIKKWWNSFKRSLDLLEYLLSTNLLQGNEKKTTKEQCEDINTQTALLGPRRRQTNKEPTRTKCKVWLYEYTA